MRKYILGALVGIMISMGAVAAATWNTIQPNVDGISACFANGTQARVVLIYKNFEGELDDTDAVRCYPQGGVN